MVKVDVPQILISLSTILGIEMLWYAFNVKVFHTVLRLAAAPFSWPQKEADSSSDCSDEEADSSSDCSDEEEGDRSDACSDTAAVHPVRPSSVPFQERKAKPQKNAVFQAAKSVEKGARRGSAKAGKFCIRYLTIQPKV